MFSYKIMHKILKFSFISIHFIVAGYDKFEMCQSKPETKIHSDTDPLILLILLSKVMESAFKDNKITKEKSRKLRQVNSRYLTFSKGQNMVGR